MTLKTVLAFLQNLDDEDRVLDAAFPVARAFGSHLIGFHAEPGEEAFSTPAYYAQQRMRVESAWKPQVRMAEMEARFRERARRDDIQCEWRSVETRDTDTSDAVIPSARCADLVVAAQPDTKKHRNAMAGVEKVVFEGGRPVLFVPWAARIPERFDTVLIAWNGTREAARATFDAMPFILAAKKVEIFTVDPKQGDDQTPAFAGAEIAATLARNGAKVTVETQISDGIPTGSIIENRLADIQADLLVMGAYSRSRLSERLFGGVTRTVLESMPCITLMSR